MIRKPSAIKDSSFSSLLSKCRSIRQLNQIHAQIIVDDRESSLPQLFEFASFCAVSPHGNLSYAKTILDHQPNPPARLYNALIRGFSAPHAHPQEAMSLFLEMLRNGAKPNNMTFPFVIRACTGTPRARFGVSVHTHVLKSGLESDVYVQSSLIRFYANGKDLGSARQLFDVCPERDVVCWNSMIDAYVKSGEMELARGVFVRMPCKDVVSWNTMINGYGIVGGLGDAKKLFDEMPERNIVSWNSMLAGYVKCGNVEDALGLFRKMPRRDVVSWNTMLACYTQNGKSNEALALFDEMKSAGISPNETTVVSVLSAIAHLGALDHGSRLHTYICNQNIEMNSIVATALVDMYAKCGNITQASKVFDSIQSKDVLAWNTVIIGMGMHGHVEEAQNLFTRMRHEGVAPNDITFVAMLGAFRHGGKTEEGLELLGCMSRVYGVEPKVEHYGCVIDLLSRAGRLEEALGLMRTMPIEPNAYTWGALLGGCKIHGNAKVAGGVGKHLLRLEPLHSGRYVLLSNIYASAKRWGDAQDTRKLMRAKGVAKVPGASVVNVNGNVHPDSKPIHDEVGI